MSVTDPRRSVTAYGSTVVRQRRQRPLSPRDPRQPTAKRQGLSRTQLAAAIERQGGLCAVGGEPLGNRVMVDHCHHCAQLHGHAPERGCPSCFRGVICMNHNTALGLLGDDPAGLRSAALYAGHGRH